MRERATRIKHLRLGTLARAGALGTWREAAHEIQQASDGDRDRPAERGLLRRRRSRGGGRRPGARLARV